MADTGTSTEGDKRPASCAAQLRVLAQLMAAKKVHRTAVISVLTQIADQVQEDEADLEASRCVLQRVGLLTHLYVEPTGTLVIQ